MKVITESITKADFLAPPYQLTYNYKSSQKTCFNGILSIGIVGLTLIFGALLGKELILKEKPIVSLSEAQEEGSSVKIFDYPLIFSLQDSATLEYLNTNPAILENIQMSALELSVSHDANGLAVDYKVLLLQPCQEHMMSPSAWQALGGEAVLKLTLCVDPHRKMDLQGNILEEEVVITNPYGQINSTAFSISVNVCEDDSEDCIRARKALEKGILMGYASVHHYIDTSDFENPIKSMIKTGSVTLSLKMNILTQMQFDISKLFDDKGLVFEDLQHSSFVNFDAKGIAYILREEGDSLLTFTIGTNDLVKHVKRLYLKMTQLFANLGGLLKVSFMIGKMMAAVSSRASFYFFAKSSIRNEKARANNNSINNLVGSLNQSSSTFKTPLKTKPSLFQYAKGLFSRKTAVKYGMSDETLFKYFDAKLLENSIVSLESRQAEIDSALDQMKNEQKRPI